MDLFKFFYLFGCIVHVYYRDLLYIHYLFCYLFIDVRCNIKSLFTYLNTMYLKVVKGENVVK